MKSPLIFHVSPGPDGMAFGYPLVTERTLKAGFPGVRLADRVFIAFPSVEAMEDTRVDLWKQMLTLLTGLSPQKIETLGGWRFVDPTTGRTFAEGTPEERAA